MMMREEHLLAALGNTVDDNPTNLTCTGESHIAHIHSPSRVRMGGWSRFDIVGCGPNLVAEGAGGVPTGPDVHPLPAPWTPPTRIVGVHDFGSGPGSSTPAHRL